MNLAALKSSLDAKYDVVGFYDLADAMTKHSEIFKIFKKHYQPAFDENQRIVFYTSYSPSQLVLNHLQRAASRIDVSNYFIIICTPHDISAQLEIANKKYGNDQVVMNWTLCSVVSTNPLLDHNIYPIDTFCALPFSALTVDPNNSVSPCCKYANSVGSVTDSGLLDIFNNSAMQHLREDIKKGIMHTNCNVCWNVESSGGTSHRNHHNIKQMDNCDHGWLDDLHIRDLTVAPSTLCNFKCRICSPYASSKIAVEELKFTTDPGKLTVLKNLVKLSKGNSITPDQIVGIANNLNFLHVLGGEPFKWQELDLLLSDLIDTEYAKHIQIEFNTNGSIFPQQTITKLLEFKSVEILISIDDIEDRFELQRGGSWPEILKNIISFKNLKSSTISIKLIPTVNIQNLLYLDKLIEFSQLHQLEIVWCYLEHPSHLCIDNVTQSVKNIVSNRYANHSNSELQSIANRMLQTNPVSGDLFLNYMQTLDHRRDQKSSVVLKEIFDAMST